MLLSDDYAKAKAKKRTRLLTTNREINRVAASGIAFRPVESAGGSSGHAYTAVIEGVQYLAVFNWSGKRAGIMTDCKRAGIPEGLYTDLWSGKSTRTKKGILTWRFKGTDAVLLRLEEL